GIRDFHVTGVQTCALPICLSVDQFDFAQAASVAARLDHLARDAAGAAPGVASPWAALIRARARLRQSAPDGADAALAPVLAALPDRKSDVQETRRVSVEW